MTKKDSVTKTDIVRQISERIGETQLKTKEIVQRTFDAIVATLLEVGRIELRKFGVLAHSADYVLQGGAADAREAELLDVAIGAPLLIATATAHLQSGKAMELSHSIFRSDRYRFRTTLFRSAWK